MPLSTPDVLIGRPAVARVLPRAGVLPLVAATSGAALAGLAWGGPIVVRMIADSDFPFHLASAEQFAGTGRITVPHFLLQVVLGMLIATRMFASTASAGVVFFCGVYMATAAAACWYIARAGDRRTSLAASAILAVAVLMAAPIVPRSMDDLFLIGYFPPNVYHNPTMLVAKPLLVWALVSAVAAFTRTGAASWRELTVLALPVVLLGIAKPNYLGCLVPVVAGAALWNRVTAQPVSLVRAFAICSAAVLTLVGSWALYRSDQLGFEAGVIVAPLRVIALYSPVDAFSLVRHLVVSVAFPLVVIALWPRDAWRDPAMRIALGGTVAGLFFSYVMAESGPRLPDGNFLWTGQMAVFVLFLASARFARERLTLRGASGVMFGRLLAVAVVLALHVEAGIRHARVKVDPLQWLTFWT